MIRLHPDPAVAIVAYRLASESRPDETHDVALLLGEATDECPVSFTGKHREHAQGTRIVCAACVSVLRWWDCTCERATLAEKPCRHIPIAIQAYAAERAGRTP